MLLDFTDLWRTRGKKQESETPDIVLRKPVKADGPAVTDLIAECPPLDENSRYCNLLQCTDFTETCVLAEAESGLLGWISGYIPPRTPESLFIWQVAVHADGRGQGLGKRMLRELLNREAARDCRYLRTTITRDNDASWGLFGSFAKELDTELDHRVHFCREKHFDSQSKTEHELTIGPFKVKDLAAAA